MNQIRIIDDEQGILLITTPHSDLQIDTQAHYMKGRCAGKIGWDEQMSILRNMGRNT